MDSDNYNNDFYNSYADEFDKIPFGETLTEIIPKYLRVPNHILEIGSGAGALAKWLTDKGHTVICLEPAAKAAARAQNKGLEVVITRFQDYMTNERFDAIIAISSLIHIPREDIPNQLQQIHKMLTSGGVAIITFLIGDHEGPEDPTQKGKLRFFSKFTVEKIESLVTKDFLILESREIEVSKMNQSFLLLALTGKR